MKCPDYEEILAAAGEASLPPDFEAHAGGCALCGARLQLARNLLKALAAGPLPEVPAAASRKARGLAASKAPGVLERVREFLAELVFDSARDRPALALRGQGLARRHLLFRAGGYELDVAWMEPDSLVGQVLPEDPDAATLSSGTCVLSGAGGEREAPISAGGEFRFGGVAPGRYGLWVQDDRVCLVVGELDLREGGEPR